MLKSSVCRTLDGISGWKGSKNSHNRVRRDAGCRSLKMHQNGDDIVSTRKEEHWNVRHSPSRRQPGFPQPSVRKRLVNVRVAATDDGMADDNRASIVNNRHERILKSFSSPWDKEILSLSIPALLSLLLDPLMGIVDTAIVGRLGTAPLAAVGISTVVYNFSNFIWNFLLYTTTPRIAGAAARGDKNEISRITSQGMWVASMIGITMMSILWFKASSIFISMGGSATIVEHAVPYIRGRCLASPAILMFYVVAGTFRGFKDTKYVYFRI